MKKFNVSYIALLAASSLVSTAAFAANTNDFSKMNDAYKSVGVTQTGDLNVATSGHYKGYATTVNIKQVGTANTFRLNPTMSATDPRVTSVINLGVYTVTQTGNNNNTTFNALGTSPLPSYGSNVNITQTGNSNRTANSANSSVEGGPNKVTQRIYGNSNGHQFTVSGNNNTVNTNVGATGANGNYNRITQQATGDSNKSTVTSSGTNASYNSVNSKIVGSGNTSDIYTYAGSNTLTSNITGSNNLSKISSNDRGYAESNITGNSNNVGITLTGGTYNTVYSSIGTQGVQSSNNQLAVAVNGSNNSIKTGQFGNGNYLNVAVNGSNNGVGATGFDFNQNGGGKRLTFNYTGSNVQGPNGAPVRFNQY